MEMTYRFKKNKNDVLYLTVKRLPLVLLVVALAFFCGQPSAMAQGTSVVSPNSANITALTLLPSNGSGSYLGCPVDNRIYFNIASSGTENLYYGFNWRNYAAPIALNPTINNVYIKIFNPNGTLAAGPILLNNAGAGFINTHPQAIAGPNIAGLTPAGYTPLAFTPSVTGEHWIELYRSLDGGVTQAATNVWSLAPYFDLTVATAAGVRKNGRVHSGKWGFVAIDSTFVSSALASSEASVFAYTGDSTVLKIGFQAGFKPIAYDLAVNLFGVTNGGNFANDRKSINSATSPTLTGGYKLFLSSPDPVLYPIAPVPANPTFASPIFIGCTPGTVQIRYTLAVAGDTRIFFDLNGAAGYQAGTADRIVEIFGETPGFKVYSWNGLDGLGAPVAANSTFSLTLTALQGRFNVPIFDAEINKNGLVVSSVAPIATANTTLYWDDASLTNVGTTCATVALGVDNQNNLTGTGINNLGGTLSPTHAWSGNGNPAIALPAPAVGANEIDSLQCSDFGNVRVINTYGYAVNTFATSGTIVAFKCITLAGTVWIDANNSAAGTNNNIFTAGEVGTNIGGTLFATLIDPATGKVLQSVAVAANGTYSFSNVPVNANNMEVRITNSLGVAGNTPPAVSILPTGWTNTSPLSQTVNTGIVNLTGIDFGVRQIPPVVTIGVNNAIVCVGGSALLTANPSSGNGTYTYVWQSSTDSTGSTWTTIAGATSITFPAPTATAGTVWYHVIVTSGGLSVTSASVKVVVVADPIVSITTTVPTICIGASVQLNSASSGGTGTCTLQWQSSTNGTTWTNIAGETNVTYTTPAIAPTTPLHYRVQITCTGNGCCN